MTRPEYRVSRWPGASSRQKAATAGEKPCPAYRPAGLGARGAPFPPSGAETGALTLLTGVLLSPGSQRSTTAKGQPKQRRSPARRDVAQHKQSQPRHLEAALAMPQGPFAQRASRAPSSAPSSLLPRRSALDLEAASRPACSCPVVPRLLPTDDDALRPDEPQLPKGTATHQPHIETLTPAHHPQNPPTAAQKPPAPA